MMLSKNRIFIFNILTAFNNRGDPLINKALIDRLREFGNIAVITPGIPKHFLTNLELREEEKYDSFSSILFKNIGRNKLVKVGIPGHNFDETPANTKSIIEVAYTVIFKLLFNFSFLRVGNSFGSLHKSRIKIEKIKSSMYCLYGVRDRHSVEMCNSKSIKYFPDLAFVSSEIYPAKNRIDSVEKDNYILLSFRSGFPEGKAGNDYITSLTSKIIEYVNSRSESTVKICYQVPEDKLICEKLFNKLSQNSNKKILFENHTLELNDALSNIRQADLVISNRLHVLLPALISGVPHISLTDLSQHHKLVKLYETINADFVLHDIYLEKAIKLHNENNKENLLAIADKQRELAMALLKESLGDC